MYIGYIRRGLAIYDKESGLILASGNANKRRFERQLARAVWSRTIPGELYQSTEASPRWYPPNDIPGEIEPYKITPVYVLMVIGGDIVRIHWYKNKKAAQIAFRKAGWRVIG